MLVWAGEAIEIIHLKYEFNFILKKLVVAKFRITRGNRVRTIVTQLGNRTKEAYLHGHVDNSHHHRAA
jgi:hypothetical protein